MSTYIMPNPGTEERKNDPYCQGWDAFYAGKSRPESGHLRQQGWDDAQENGRAILYG